MYRLGVVGVGVMGSDIALNCAAYGYEVLAVDFQAAALESLVQQLPRKLRGYRMLGCELKDSSAKEILARIRTSTALTELSDVDIVIESVTENKSIKRELYQKLNDICSKDAVFAVNTSCTSITELAAVIDNPQRMVGAHFMNPVPMKSVVEVIRGFHTSKNTIEKLELLIKTLGKKSIVVEDSPGFVVNRLSHLFMNEAAFLVQEGIAKPQEIDELFRLGYGHKMGPLETADLIGLDTVMDSLNILYESMQDIKFRCCPLLKKMVNAGLLGRKSGKGFYEYGDLDTSHF